MPHWFLTCLIAVFLPGSPVAEAGKKPPNLIVFLTDQQRVDTLGAYGNTQIRTPHLDRLARRSFVFDSFYVSNPVCTPSRASLLTGLYPNKHGSWMNSIPLDPKVPILVEMLRDPEYASAYYGKWHLGNEIFKQRGFTDFDSTEIYQKWWSEDQDHSQRSGYYHFLKQKGIEADTPYGHSRDLTNRLSKELSKPVYLAQRGIRFLEQHRDRPFVLYLSFLEPHAFADHKQGPPFTNVYGDLYDPADMPIPDSFFEEMDPTVSFAKRLMRLALARGELPIAYPQTVQELREAMARYWGLVTLVDEMVGRVLERLRELGLEQNTIVVFTSEHGEMMGDHRLMSKMNSYEEAATVPFLLSVPGLWDRSRRIKKPVSQVDVTPTLLDLMGQPLPDHLQGESWADDLRTGREFPDRDILVVGDEPGYAPPWNARHIYHHRTLITPEGWKMTVSDAGDGELYHLGRDPKEMKNLYFLPEYQEQVRKMWDRLRARMKEVEDPVVLDLNQPWPQRRGGQPKFP